MTGFIAIDGEEFPAHSGGQDWMECWLPPTWTPDGTRHGSAGVCVTREGSIVLISGNGIDWELPGGRPEGDETWEETLRREVFEEACAKVLDARLLGFARGRCIEGHEKGLVLVRSMWRADVELGPWDPQFEVTHRLVVPAMDAPARIGLDSHPFAQVIRRALHEAGVAFNPEHRLPED